MFLFLLYFVKRGLCIISACAEPYFGINCSQECSNCFNQSCHEVTGVCKVQVMAMKRFFVRKSITQILADQNLFKYSIINIGKCNTTFIILIVSANENHWYRWRSTNCRYSRGKPWCCCRCCSHRCRINYIQAVNLFFFYFRVLNI